MRRHRMVHLWRGNGWRADGRKTGHHHWRKHAGRRHLPRVRRRHHHRHAGRHVLRRDLYGRHLAGWQRLGRSREHLQLNGVFAHHQVVLGHGAHGVLRGVELHVPDVVADVLKSVRGR